MGPQAFGWSPYSVPFGVTRPDGAQYDVYAGYMQTIERFRMQEGDIRCYLSYQVDFCCLLRHTYQEDIRLADSACISLQSAVT